MASDKTTETTSNAFFRLFNTVKNYGAEALVIIDAVTGSKTSNHSGSLLSGFLNNVRGFVFGEGETHESVNAEFQVLLARMGMKERRDLIIGWMDQEFPFELTDNSPEAIKRLHQANDAKAHWQKTVRDMEVTSQKAGKGDDKKKSSPSAALLYLNNFAKKIEELKRDEEAKYTPMGLNTNLSEDQEAKALADAYKQASVWNRARGMPHMPTKEEKTVLDRMEDLPHYLHVAAEVSTSIRAGLDAQHNKESWLRKMIRKQVS